jgi:hypothetical protein
MLVFDEVAFVSAGNQYTPKPPCQTFSNTAFRHSRSQRSGSTCRVSRWIAIYGCHYATHIAMCSLLYRHLILDSITLATDPDSP